MHTQTACFKLTFSAAVFSLPAQSGHQTVEYRRVYVEQRCSLVWGGADLQ